MMRVSNEIIGSLGRMKERKMTERGGLVGVPLNSESERPEFDEHYLG